MFIVQVGRESHPWRGQHYPLSHVLQQSLSMVWSQLYRVFLWKRSVYMYILCVYIYLQAADKRKTRSSIMIEESEDMEDDRRRGQMFPNPPKKNRGHQLAASSVYDNLFSSNFKLSARGFHICWVSVSVLLCGFNITAETASLWSTFRHTMWSWETASFWPLSQHSSSLPVVYSTVDIHCGVKRLPALLPLSLDELPASGLKIQSMSPRKASEGLPFTFRNFIFLPSIFSILFLSLLFQSSFSCAQILYNVYALVVA